jgi:hypothetical protein
LCDVLSRSNATAGRLSNDCIVVDPAGGGDSDSFKEYSAKKDLISAEFLADRNSSIMVMSACVFMEPTDFVSQRIQQLDFVGGSMVELPIILQMCQERLFIYSTDTHHGMQLLLNMNAQTSPLAVDALYDMCLMLSSDISSQVWARFEILLENPPFSALYAARELYDLPMCCVDESFTEPIRHQFLTFLDFERGVDDSGLLLHLRRRLLATNMSLEGMIAEVKQSVPYSKCKPYIESLSYLGMLTELHKRFAGAGRTMGALRRKDLLTMDCPLVKAPKRKHGTARPKLQWIAAHVHRNMGSHAKSVKWRDAHDAWNAMPACDQARAIRDLQPLDSHTAPGIDVGIPEPYAEADTHGVDDWTYMAPTLPLDPCIMSRFFGCEFGFARKASKLRWVNRPRLLVCDKGAIPDNRQYVRRLSCSERHPGLCFSRDSDVYTQAILLAGNIERYLCAADRGAFFVFSDPTQAQ